MKTHTRTLLKKNRKIVEFQFDIKIMIIFTRRFQILLQFLFNEYNIIRNVIDVQIDFDVEIFIQKLQKKNQFKINKKIVM